MNPLLITITSCTKPPSKPRQSTSTKIQLNQVSVNSRSYGYLSLLNRRRTTPAGSLRPSKWTRSCRGKGHLFPHTRGSCTHHPPSSTNIRTDSCRSHFRRNCSPATASQCISCRAPSLGNARRRVQSRAPGSGSLRRSCNHSPGTQDDSPCRCRPRPCTPALQNSPW